MRKISDSKTLGESQPGIAAPELELKFAEGTRFSPLRGLALLFTGFLTLTLISSGYAQEIRQQPSISLAPSVVMLQSHHGAAHSQSLRMTNKTAQPMAFEMEAADVVTNNGQRVFVPAGEEPGSIAATAVFSSKEVVVAPGSTAEVFVTLTVPTQTAIRAVAVFFRGKTMIPSKEGVMMTASLGSLFTFTLSDEFGVQATPIEISEQTEYANVGFSQLLTNIGSEPVIPGGVVALLNDTGALVGKVPIEAQRLLPGERLEFRPEYPTYLSPGNYRAILSVQYEDKVLTTSSDFRVASAPGPLRASDFAAEPVR